MTSKLILKWKIYFSLLMAFLVIVVSSGCAITLVSKYDEKTENYASDFRTQVDTFLTALERNAGEPVKLEATHAQNTKFYDDARITIRGMHNRAIQIDKNKFTVQQIELLMDNVSTLEALHKLGPISPASIASTRSSFESICGAIIKLEILKKRGES